MTLHLSYVSGSIAVHASDRRLIYKAPVDQLPGVHDIFANKTVVLAAHNGIASIGYGGIAYIDAVPTDEWIASVLWRERVPSDIGATLTGPRRSDKSRLDLGGYTSLLIAELNKRFASLRPRARDQLIVGVTGMQWPSRGAPLKSVEWTIANHPDDLDRFRIVRERPRVFNSREACLRAIPMHSLVRPRDTVQELGRAGSPEEIRKILERTIQRVAAFEPTVGPDVMTVVINPTAEPHAHTYFEPGLDMIVGLLGAQGRTPLAFSPWVVSRSMLVAPGVMASSDICFSSDGLSTAFHGVRNSPFTFWFPQKRQPNRAGNPVVPVVKGLERYLRRMGDPPSASKAG